MSKIDFMKTPLLNKLREHLASISQEDFKKEWAEIKALGLQGPTMEEFIHSISSRTTVSNISIISQVKSTVELEMVVVDGGENNNYSSAA